MTPFVLGLDISKTRTGVCFGHVGETPRFASIACAGMDDAMAMKKLGGWLIDFSKLNRIGLLAAEAALSPGAFMGDWNADKGKVEMKTNPVTTITLAKMVGVVEFITGMKNIRYEAAHVQSVRKAFLGSGRPDNPKQVAAAMCRELGWSPSNNDEADAAAVWFWGCLRIDPHHAEPITPMTQAKVIGLVNPKPFEKQGGGAR